MALLTVLQSKDGLKVTAVPAIPNQEIAKNAISAVSSASKFTADTSTSVNLANISDSDFAKLYIGAPLTAANGVAAGSIIIALIPVAGANKATLNNATTTTVVGNSLIQNVSTITVVNVMPPQSLIVSETLAAIDAFTS